MYDLELNPKQEFIAWLEKRIKKINDNMEQDDGCKQFWKARLEEVVLSLNKIKNNE